MAGANTAAPGSIASMLTGVSGAASPASGNPLTGTSGTGGILGDIFGQVPGVASPTGSASSAIQGNIGNLTENANLSQGADTISAAGAQLPYEMNLPDYNSMTSTASGNALSELGGNIPGLTGLTTDLGTASGNVSQELSGQLPQDVVDQISQQSAERGVASGQGTNSPNSNASFLQSLGLTSLEQEQTGLSNLSSLESTAQAPLTTGQNDLASLVGITPTGTEENPSSMFVTPEDEQSAQEAALTSAAAPDPSASGLFSSIMSFL